MKKKLAEKLIKRAKKIIMKIKYRLKNWNLFNCTEEETTTLNTNDPITANQLREMINISIWQKQNERVNENWKETK